MIAAGDPFVEAFATPDWSFHELPTGYWPMFSTPGSLAEILLGLRAGG